ncbi:NADP-dependent alcohol dehydrogenase-like protein [Hirsutella rhossiliensis]|uniref:NADP-dependent alcohol dehydrogenase-like protein n=1 Tax=Hirsutella rhossiliensis TaxID=111463 RepID=A0A9P8N1M2_9HYPO|nr:NADP-dependent alcohol dehydrogenase-like protein [Hirsutella rhossiliensis]KAH0965998.1 NADP-dependent alcohol dehydrogenase-like protein [Hirsutella rhossiliensis]
MSAQRIGFRLPAAYRVFFLLIEPMSAVVGVYFSHLRQTQYLQLLHAESAPSRVPPSTSVALSQLANMYLFFALNEALVLRSTWDLRVWRTVLAVLLIADFGHLYAMKELGLNVYYTPAGWNISHLANIPWVYAGATMRICFLAGIGLQGSKRSQKQQ